MEDLAGKVAFVTGGASGIGLAMAKSFAGDGMKLVLADIEVDALEKAEQDLRESGAEVVGVRCDVSDRASVEAAAERAFEAFGARAADLPAAPAVVLAVPAQHMRSVVQDLRPVLASATVLVNLTKGIEISSQKRMSEIIAEHGGVAWKK